jgi:hypothetical protein
MGHVESVKILTYSRKEPMTTILSFPCYHRWASSFCPIRFYVAAVFFVEGEDGSERNEYV